MKKSVPGLLSLVLIMFSCFFSFNSEAESSSWARPSIVRLELSGILDGTLDFEPGYQSKLVREEFCELLVKFYLYVEGGSVESFGKISPFSDTDNKYVIAANKLGFVNGLSDTEFGPRSEITREQVATMLARALEKMKLGIKADKISLFKDDADISSWAKESVYFCRNNSILQGLGDGRFGPKLSATKEQLVKMIDDTLEHFGKDNIKLSIRDKAFYNYKIPTKSLAHLDYSISNAEPRALRITMKDEGLNYSDFDVVSAAYEVYTVTADVIGHPKARKIALMLKNEWSETDLSFSKNKDYGLDSGLQFSVLKVGDSPDVILSFNGNFIIDIFK